MTAACRECTNAGTMPAEIAAAAKPGIVHLASVADEAAEAVLEGAAPAATPPPVEVVAPLPPEADDEEPAVISAGAAFTDADHGAACNASCNAKSCELEVTTSTFKAYLRQRSEYARARQASCQQGSRRMATHGLECGARESQAGRGLRNCRRRYSSCLFGKCKCAISRPGTAADGAEAVATTAGGKDG